MSFLYFAFAALYGKINQKSFFYFILAACSTASLIARNSLHPHYMKFSKLVSTIFKRKFCLIGYILPYSIAGAVFLQHLKNETSFTATADFAGALVYSSSSSLSLVQSALYVASEDCDCRNSSASIVLLNSAVGSISVTKFSNSSTVV